MSVTGQLLDAWRSGEHKVVHVTRCNVSRASRRLGLSAVSAPPALDGNQARWSSPSVTTKAPPRSTYRRKGSHDQEEDSKPDGGARPSAATRPHGHTHATGRRGPGHSTRVGVRSGGQPPHRPARHGHRRPCPRLLLGLRLQRGRLEAGVVPHRGRHDPGIQREQGRVGLRCRRLRRDHRHHLRQHRIREGAAARDRLLLARVCGRQPRRVHHVRDREVRHRPDERQDRRVGRRPVGRQRRRSARRQVDDDVRRQRQVRHQRRRQRLVHLRCERPAPDQRLPQRLRRARAARTSSASSSTCPA